MVETYGRAMVCEGTTRNISLLKDGDPVGPSSNWVIGGNAGNQHAMYTNWNKKPDLPDFGCKSARISITAG